MPIHLMYIEKNEIYLCNLDESFNYIVRNKLLNNFSANINPKLILAHSITGSVDHLIISIEMD